jgi:hypothetical protein
LINLWQTQGLKLWLQQDVSMTLVSGQSAYTVTPGGSVNMTKPFRITEAYYLSSVGQRRPLTALSRHDYFRLSAPTPSGAVSQFYVDKQQASLNVSLWPAPSALEAAGTVHLLLQAQATNPVSLTETLNFPAEWRIALRWGLADELATGQPQAIMDRCSGRAQSFREALENADIEDVPIRFGVDLQGQGMQRSFR